MDGQRIACAGTLAEARHTISTNRFDLMICWVGLPYVRQLCPRPLPNVSQKSLRPARILGG
jgi:hypothetical protein